MRSTSIALALLTASLTVGAGCEHKSKTQSSGDLTAGGGGGSAANQTPTPTPNAPAPTPAPSDKTVEQAVRPPVAADLAEYTKDLPGSGNKLLAKFETSAGTINCELFPEKAPMTVANFVGLATGKKAWQNPKTGKVEQGTPFYDGLIFHRVIPEFMIQGGDPLGQGVGGPGYQFGDETDNGLEMEPGTLAMANAGPGTNGSQFFITEIGPDWLNGKHTIFGKCAEVDVVKKMARLPQNAQNKPNEPVTMKVTITKG